VNHSLLLYIRSQAREEDIFEFVISLIGIESTSFLLGALLLWDSRDYSISIICIGYLLSIIKFLFTIIACVSALFLLILTVVRINIMNTTITVTYKKGIKSNIIINSFVSCPDY
jgi:hypothetical protein